MASSSDEAPTPSSGCSSWPGFLPPLVIIFSLWHELIVFLPAQFRCCGVTNHTDWFEVYNASRVPDSCCLEYSDNCGLDNPGTWWTAPCYERVKDWLNENLVALWIFALCTALTQVLGLVFSMTMFCQAVKVETFYA
uniref:tetraspanin-4-like n=1 Tax=Maylandia zebra TaxID=106582 RepID=UPI000D2F7D77|nr:tetraspanin-4-like [Maylandia zebra]